METTIIPGQTGVPNGQVPNGENGEQPKIETQAVPEWAREIAEVKGQMTAVKSVLDSFATILPQLQQQSAPPPPPAPQVKSLAELIIEAKLPDPLSATNADEYNQAVAEKLGSAFEPYMNSLLEQRLENSMSSFRPIVEDYNQRRAETARQQQLSSVVANIKASNPEYAGIPDSQIAQALDRVSTDYGVFGKLLSPLLKPAQPTHQPQAQNNAPDPGLASMLPTGASEAQLAQLRDTFNKLKTPGFAEQLMTQDRGMDLIMAANAAARAHNW